MVNAEKTSAYEAEYSQFFFYFVPCKIRSRKFIATSLKLLDFPKVDSPHVNEMSPPLLRK